MFRSLYDPRFRPDAYVTDGKTLWRVVEVVESAEVSPARVTLEDSVGHVHEGQRLYPREEVDGDKLATMTLIRRAAEAA